MQTIKFLDLLNKISKREKVPKEVRYNGIIYKYEGANRGGIRYVNKNPEVNGVFQYLMFHINNLNDEVEIVEEKPVTVEEVKKDLKYVIDRVLKAFERHDCIDWNFTDIREKYGFDDEEEDE